MMMPSISVFFFYVVFIILSTSSFAEHGNPSKHARPLPNDYITYAADNSITLFVNSKNILSINNWSRFATIPLPNLKIGDVVSFEVKDYGGWYGFISSLHTKHIKEPLVSGGDSYLAINSNDLPKADENKWKLPTYDGACSVCSRWRRPVIRPKAGIWHPGKATFFPSPSKARYVWAENSKEKDKIYVRLRVGGENCDVHQSKKARIVFACDNEIEVFLNGNLLDWSSKWKAVTTTEIIDLKKGDVVSARAKDLGGPFGAIIAIRFLHGENVVTGKDDWRSVQEFKIEGDKDSWMYPTYGDCRWSHAVLSHTFGQAKEFPFADTSAKYVWASGAFSNSKIFLRTVIGGRSCDEW